MKALCINSSTSIAEVCVINGEQISSEYVQSPHSEKLMVAVDKLKGHPKFGYVKLLKTERSETAAMADLLD